jgi:hypothetical protein
MYENDLHDKEGGQVLSMDLLLALVVIAVFLGASANAMDLVSSKMDEASYIHSLERITTGNANILLNTPGSPENWEEGLQPMSLVKPGLAQVDPVTGAVNKTLNMKKVLKLAENYQELMDGKVLPFGLNSTMIVSPRDSSLDTITVNNQEHSETARDVLIINRTIMCDYMIANILTSIPSNQASGTLYDKFKPLLCPHCNLTLNYQHPQQEKDEKKMGWKCKPFIVTQNDINTTDIYIMTDPPQILDESACWIIDSTQNLTDVRYKFTSSPDILNEKLSQLLGERENATIWLHVFSSGNSDEAFAVYIGRFSKNTPNENIKIQYLTPQPCNFVFKVWI